MAFFIRYRNCQNWAEYRRPHETGQDVEDAARGRVTQNPVYINSCGRTK